jgi:hypothetical protein
MSEPVPLLALFDEATAVAQSIDNLHMAGVRDDDVVVITGVPYPEKALERQVEWLRLPYIVLAGAFGGLLFGLFLSVITPHLYRLDIGGHPPVGFPPAGVITFVFTMMATIISTFLGVIWEMGFPELGPKYYHKAVSDGQLAVVVQASEELQERAREILREGGAVQIQRAEKQPL